MKIIIPDIPPSNNKFAGRKNVHEYRRLKEEWLNKVYYMAKTQCGWQEPFQKAIVTLTYYFPTKVRHDPDNYSGKFILDGLKQAGIIADDSFSNIELILRCGGVDKLNPRTEISVREG